MFKSVPEFWPHMAKKEEAQPQQADRRARTAPLFLDELKEVLGTSGLTRSPAQARRRQMRLLFC